MYDQVLNKEFRVVSGTGQVVRSDSRVRTVKISSQAKP
jgi:hypothetical protein